MAQVDPNIALSIRQVQIPLEESPLNRMRGYAEYENALLKSQEMQRGISQRNALAKIHADPNVKVGSPEYLSLVQQRAPDLYEPVAARALQRADLEEKIEGRKAQNFERKFKLFQSITPSLRTIDDVTQFVAASYADPDLGPVLSQIRPYEVALTTNQDAFNEDPDNWRLQAAGVSPKEIAEIARNKAKEEREANKPVVVSAGGQLVSPTGDVLFSADQKAPTDPELVKEYKFATDPARGKQQFKGSLLEFKEAFARAGRPISTTQAAPTVTMVLDPNDSTRMLSIDAKTYKGGSLGSPGVIGVAGKEPTVGKKQEAKETAQNNASAIIAKLRQSYDRLDELGGITSTENRAGTNISARMGASPVGQTVGSFFGTKTQAERDKIEQTRPLLMTTIMQAMGLSAKQLDSNAELKLWLSSATDPTKSLEANREALNELERLLTGGGKGAPAAPKTPAAPKAPAIGTVQEGYRFKGGNPADQKNWEKVK
jgi:hypothetical protein